MGQCLPPSSKGQEDLDKQLCPNHHHELTMELGSARASSSTLRG